MTITSRLLFVALTVSAILGGKTLLARKLAEDDRGRPSSLLRPLQEFPDTLGEWTGRDEPAKQEILEMMKLDDHLQRIYRHPSGQQVVLWISFSKSSRDQYHYPSVCMQGAGWEEDESARVHQVVEAGAPAPPVRQIRMKFAKDRRQQQYVYYWYYLVGESSVDQAMRKLSRQARLFLRGRHNASVTVEVFCPTEEATPEVLDDFAKDVVTALSLHLPDQSVGDCELGAGL